MIAEAAWRGVYFKLVLRLNNGSFKHDYKDEDNTNYQGGPSGLSAF
jgi:hypothetical protein